MKLLEPQTLLLMQENFGMSKNLIPWKLATEEELVVWQMNGSFSTMINCQKGRPFPTNYGSMIKKREPTAAWIKWKSGNNTFDTVLSRHLPRLYRDGTTVRFTMHPS